MEVVKAVDGSKVRAVAGAISFSYYYGFLSPAWDSRTGATWKIVGTSLATNGLSSSILRRYCPENRPSETSEIPDFTVK